MYWITLVLLFAIPAPAQTIREWIEQAGDQKDYPQYSHLVVFDSIKTDVKPSGLTYVNTHRLYKVLNNDGAKKLNAITYGYDPLSAYVEIRKVKIWRKNGGVEEIGMDQTYDYPAPARMIYWGAREKMIETGRLEPGDAVEVFLFRKGFTYALLAGDDDKYIPPMRGHFYDIVRFFGKVPILKIVYQVDVPKNKPVQYKFYNGKVEVASTFVNDKIRYLFKRDNNLPVKHEPGMVSEDNVSPKLLMSTSPDWEAKSRWFYGVNEDYGSFNTTPAISRKVDEIVRDAQTEMDSISLLTHWVADNIRYSGLSMGQGEGYTLHKGSMTFRDRCGVCKDKAGMLITMLRAAGFESYAAMTMAGSRIERIPADQFNHSVTVVKLADGTYKLLDPTWVPFVRELWSSAEQQQNYLMGLPQGADLMKTPVSNPKNHYFVMKINARLTAKGSLSGDVYVTAEGQTDAAIRRNFTSGFRSEWERNLIRELKKWHPGLQVKNMDYGKPYQYLKGPIEIKISFEIPDYAMVTKEGLIYEPLSGKDAFKHAMAHLYFPVYLKSRTHAFRDRCSRSIKITEKIMLPDHQSEEFFKDSLNADSQAARYAGAISVKNNVLTIEQEAIFNKRVYEASEWPGYRKAVMQQQKLSQSPVLLYF
jgi:hypothetical protein